jgi:uncharacterized membrane protein SpoIIM required for sporulation
MPSPRIPLSTIARSLKANLARLTEQQKKTSHASARDGQSLALTFQVIEEYEKLSSAAYSVRAARGQVKAEARIREADDILAQAAHEILSLSTEAEPSESGYRRFVRGYRQVWRKHLGMYFFCVFFFLGTCFLGFNIGANHPEYVPVIAGQSMMEMIHDHTAWFEEIQKNPIESGLGIALNNIKVSLAGFFLGALLGLGGIIILGYNGISFGVILGYCYAYDFHRPLISFVLSHGPLELTVIIASCFSGLVIGRVFYARPRSLFRERMREAGHDASLLALGVIPWLILAAVFEAGVSPSPFFSNQMKITFGFLAALAFYVWAFAPLPPLPESPSGKI